MVKPIFTSQEEKNVAELWVALKRRKAPELPQKSLRMRPDVMYEINERVAVEPKVNLLFIVAEKLRDAFGELRAHLNLTPEYKPLEDYSHFFVPNCLIVPQGNFNAFTMRHGLENDVPFPIGHANDFPPWADDDLYHLYLQADPKGIYPIYGKQASR